MEIEGTCVSKNFNETVRLQSEIIREVRDYKGLRRAQVALPVWPAHQPRYSAGETSVRGPIVVLIEQKERESVSAREFEIRGKDRTRVG